MGRKKRGRESLPPFPSPPAPAARVTRTRLRTSQPKMASSGSSSGRKVSLCWYQRKNYFCQNEHFVPTGLTGNLTLDGMIVTHDPKWRLRILSCFLLETFQVSVFETLDSAIHHIEIYVVRVIHRFRTTRPRSFVFVELFWCCCLVIDIWWMRPK